MPTSAHPQPRLTDRPRLLEALAQPREYDLAVIGGGATGLGVALDAALRGLSVVLLESHDFAKGTSSRATKLVHGGVRYLAQGNVSLVREALHERTTLLHNAPHLAQPLAFVMPSYKFWETPFYGAGLKIYDMLAGKAGLGPTEFLGAAGASRCLPGIRVRGLCGGVKYWDGQFDDARLALALARTAAERGALVVNYCGVTGLLHEHGRIVGLRCQDAEFGSEYTLRARAVVNAAGVWVDEIRRQDGAALGRSVKPMVAPSQGVHLVVDREFLPGEHALLVPKTRDGRVLFAVPWLGKLVLGTTDTPRHDLALEPDAYAREVEFILSEAAHYLQRAPTRADVKSIWVGLRPLVRPPDDEDGESTKKISREHTVLASPSGLVTVTGGKWTTYRAMAEDVLDKCVQTGLFDSLVPSRTADFKLVGAIGAKRRTRISQPPGLDAYGSEAACVQALEGSDVQIVPGLSAAMVRFAVRYEYARCVEDVLARRFRLLFLDARLAAEVAPRVAGIVQQETGLDPRLGQFLDLTRHYLNLPS